MNSLVEVVIVKAKYFLFSLSSFVLIGCQAIKYASVIEEDGFFSTEVKETFRGDVQTFSDNLLSNKLDLVIVLDTQVGMENFYKENIFGANFLDHFKEFDWRVAYTDTSISGEFFQTPDDKESDTKEENQKSCKGLISSSLQSGLLGIVLESPFFLFQSLNSFSECIVSIRERNKEKKQIKIVSKEANGDFLVFEHKREKVELTKNYLTKATESYNEIFNDTMVFRTYKKRWWFEPQYYEAPVLRELGSSPLLSVLLSFSKKINESGTDVFFREDSQIVYVVVTPEDGKIDMEGSQLKESLNHSLEGKNRFRLIPVTIQSKNQFCEFKFSEMGLKEVKPATKLQEIAKSLDSQSLDICSPDIGEQLAKEIKKNLHSLEDF